MLHVRQPNVASTLRVETSPGASAYPDPMAGEIGSWLSGPEPADSGSEFPGQSLGLPENGPGSLARMGRRLAALIADWSIAYGLASLAMSAGLFGRPGQATAVLVIWLVLDAVAVRLFGFTPGQYLLGLRVTALDNRLGVGRAIGRGLLIALVIPALFTDRDGRGFQDRLTATAVVRR
jgi:hypothetical protein